MLVIITGNRQVGKTRWLERFLTQAEDAGFTCVGLISPGVWERKPNGTLEKTGIQAILLPEGTRLQYAVRRDLTPQDGNADGYQQSDSAKLGWRIRDAAIDTINDHFRALRERGLTSKDILVIDEIGTLELTHGKGFTAALGMLDDPPVKDGDAANAVIIMRPELLATTEERLTPVWGKPLILDISDPESYLGIESLIRSFSSASDRS
ncbi:MAG: hypothetical protein HFJ65_04655 [Eggerthellaceae bacterium]|nr:hypothetical protein [Eggerthellaceae bacterium]